MYQENNAAEMLSLLGGSLDPYRNVREVVYCYAPAHACMRVTGILRDDSSIPVDRPRERVPSLPFDVLVPEGISMGHLLAEIYYQTHPLA